MRQAILLSVALTSSAFAAGQTMHTKMIIVDNTVHEGIQPTGHDCYECAAHAAIKAFGMKHPSIEQPRKSQNVGSYAGLESAHRAFAELAKPMKMPPGTAIAHPIASADAQRAAKQLGLMGAEQFYHLTYNAKFGKVEVLNQWSGKLVNLSLDEARVVFGDAVPFEPASAARGE